MRSEGRAVGFESNAKPLGLAARHMGGGGQERGPWERSTGAGSGRMVGCEQSSDGHWVCVGECKARGEGDEERDWRPKGKEGEEVVHQSWVERGKAGVGGWGGGSLGAGNAVGRGWQGHW